MLNKLHFISHTGFIDGGGTKPVKIEAVDKDNNIGQYVVKIFKKKHEYEAFATSKEFISSFLASEFDLLTPEYFVIKIKKDYVADLYDDEELKELHFGYHFCTKLIEGSLPFNSNAKNHFLLGYDHANIFSFDYLMLNFDRRRIKPNMLIKNDDIYIIDHEITLPFYSIPGGQKTEYTKNTFFSQTNSFNMSSHVFYHIMKKEKDKSYLFFEFEENLKRLNLSKIEILFEFFTKFNISNDGVSGLCDYLTFCRSNRYLIKSLTTKIS